MLRLAISLHPNPNPWSARPIRARPLTNSPRAIIAIAPIRFSVIVLRSENPQPQRPHPKHASAPLRKHVGIPHPVRGALALGAAPCAVQAGRVHRVEPVFVCLGDGLEHGRHQHLARAVVRDVLFELRAQERRLVLDVLPYLRRAGRGFGGRDFDDGLPVFGLDGLGDSVDKLPRKVVDGLAENGVDFGFGVEHVLDHLWDEQADELARVEEVAARAKFPEGVCDAGEVVLKVGLWGDEFYVEGYDLLFQEEQV